MKEIKNPSSHGLSRRKLLTNTAIVGASALLINAGSVSLAQANDQLAMGGFYKLAQFLTHKPSLSPAFAAAVYATMLAHTENFRDRLSTLEQALNASGATEVQSFIDALPKGDENRSFALLIIESFYTGNVGRGRHAVAVSFEKALMFQQTIDVTVIPTYIRAEPNYWAASPDLDN